MLFNNPLNITLTNNGEYSSAFSICITMITKNTFIYEAFRPSKALWVNRILLLPLETFSRQQWLMYFRLRCLEQLTEVTLCWWMWHRNPHACVILSWESFYMCFILLIGTYILIAIKMIRARTFRTGCATIFHVLPFVQGKKMTLITNVALSRKKQDSTHTGAGVNVSWMNKAALGDLDTGTGPNLQLLCTLQQVWLLSWNHVQ